MKDIRRLFDLWPWLQPYKLWIVGLLFCALAFFALAQANPLFIKWLIDGALPSGQVKEAFVIVGMYFGVILLRQVFSIFMTYAYTLLGSRISASIQHDLLAHLLDIDMQFFYLRQLGDLLARINDDVVAIREFLSITVVEILSNVITLVFALAIVTYFNWKLALATAILLPFIPLPFRLIRKHLRQTSANQRVANGANVAFIQEMLSAVLTIKVAGANKHVLSRQKEIASSLVTATVRQRVMQMLAAYTAEFMGNLLCPLLILGFGSYLVLQSELTIGELIATEMYATSLVAPVVALSKINATLQGVLASLDRVDEIIKTPILTKARVTQDEQFMAKPPYHLTSSNVQFSYNGRDNVIHNVSLTISQGEFIAVVGPSGSGKSTLAYLLSGIILPNAGVIRIGNVDVHMLHNISNILALVPQEPFLFHDTIRANICFGLEDKPDESEIHAAVQAAQIDEFINSLPEKYETLIGERGISISGGERQRLALARALLRKPYILVLDEITSALDPITEQRVLESLSTLHGYVTVVIITHRISAALRADRVYVLQNGRVSEHGQPLELLKNKGAFYQLYSEQISNSTVKQSLV